MGIIDIIGWILWGIPILLALSFSLNARSLIAKGGSISSTEFGVALLEGFLFCIVVMIFYFTTLNKLHLIWVVPVIYFGTVSLLLPGIPFISPLLARISLKVFAPLVLIGITSSPEKELGSEMINSAAASGDSEMVSKILSVHPELCNAKDRDGLTPLHLAATADVAAILIRSGADVNARDLKGNTPLVVASEYGYAGVAHVLIKAGADIYAKNDMGGTPLHYACIYGNKNIVEVLVTAGVDINAPTPDGLTALQLAEYKQHHEIVDFLLRHK